MFRMTIFADEPPPVAAAQTRLHELQRLCPALVGYVESGALPNQIDDATPAFKAISELYFASTVAAEQAAAEHRTLAALLAVTDDAPMMLCQERTVLRTAAYRPGTGIKITFPFRRLAALALADFQHYWWHQHGPIAAQTDGALCYTQQHLLPTGDGAPPPRYDAITELHFADRDTAVAAMASEHMKVDQTEDARNFVDLDSVAIVLMREQVLLAP
ncbi:MAG: EthD domain-containing protein [Pseudomonadota bacterium]